LDFPVLIFLGPKYHSRIASFCGVRIPVDVKLFSSPHPSCGPKVFFHNFYWSSFPGEKRSERGVDHSPPSSDKVENGYSATCQSLCACTGTWRFEFYVCLLYDTLRWWSPDCASAGCRMQRLCILGKSYFLEGPSPNIKI